MLQKAFKEEPLSRTQVFEWFALFKRSEMSVDDHPHSVAPVNKSYRRECRKQNRENINEDHRYTTDEISEATGVSWEFLSADFDRRFGHETRYREVCSPVCSHRTKKKHSFDFVPGIGKTDCK